MKTSLKMFLKSVNNEVKKAEQNYKQAKKSALEIAASASSSPSQSGDRYHSQGTADLAKQRFEEVKKLKDEIKVKGETVIVTYDGEELILVDNPVLLPGFKIVSTKSPLGIKLADIKHDER